LLRSCAVATAKSVRAAQIRGSDKATQSSIRPSVRRNHHRTEKGHQHLIGGGYPSLPLKAVSHDRQHRRRAEIRQTKRCANSETRKSDNGGVVRKYRSVYTPAHGGGFFLIQAKCRYLRESTVARRVVPDGGGMKECKDEIRRILLP